MVVPQFLDGLFCFSNLFPVCFSVLKVSIEIFILRLRDSFLSYAEPANELIKGILHFRYSGFDSSIAFLVLRNSNSAYIAHLFCFVLFFGHTVAFRISVSNQGLNLGHGSERAKS